MATPSKQSPNTIRLVTWACAAHSTAAASRLPTLDPDGLYAASVLQARRGATNALGDVRVLLGGPSSLLHAEVPCVEDGTTGVILASGVEAVEVFSRKLAGRKGERSVLHEASPQDGGDEETDAQIRRRKALCQGLERFIQSDLHPLVHQCLFAKALFASHTARVYQSGLGFVPRQSLPGRLRRSLQALYAERGKYIDPSNGLGPILREANSKRELIDEDRREREDLAQRAGINLRAARKPIGLAREEKEQAGRAFGQLRIVSCAEQVLDVVTQVLGSQSFLSGHDKPSLLDVRLFSLLAPLLLPEDAYPALAASPVAKLLRSSYPKLVEHSERVRLLLWPIGTTTSANGKTRAEMSDWPVVPGVPSPLDEEPLSIRVAHSLGRMTSEAYMYSVRLAKRIANADAAPAASPTATSAKGPTLSAAEQREARVIAWGRYVWIASAVVGMIGTAFASGLIKVEVADEDAGVFGGEADAMRRTPEDGVAEGEFVMEDEIEEVEGEDVGEEDDDELDDDEDDDDEEDADVDDDDDDDDDEM